MTDEELKRFAAPGCFEKVKKAIEEGNRLKEKNPHLKYYVDCYGEIRGYDRKNVSSPESRGEKIFSSPDPEPTVYDHKGFKDDDEEQEKLRKSMEKLWEEGID